jgi:predicted transcriptional regulator
VQRQSVREIARRLHVSRKTVRKAIEAEDGKFSYDCGFRDYRAHHSELMARRIPR